MDKEKAKEHARNFILEALEHEKGGVQVYETAVRCAVNKDLKKEWTKYLDQTKRHVKILTDLCPKFGLDPETRTAGRDIVKALGESLVSAMESARKKGAPEMAQIVAAECVVLAETKDHQNWELIGELVEAGNGGQALEEAHESVEDEEDEHLYHTQGWARELWLEHFGLPAVLPPPEEEKDVKTAIGAARAKARRKRML